MRVVGWNVRSLRNGRAAVVAQLRAVDADVVVLQEAPRLLLWRLSRWWLARAGGLRVATRGWAAGNVVLVRPQVEVQRSYEVRVPKRAGLHRRGAAVAVLVVEGVELAVAGTHLDLAADARLDTAARVRAALPPDLPLVLSADVNDRPGSAAWSALTAGLLDGGADPTFPAGQPSRRIDALLVRGLDVTSHEVVDVGGASDHRMLVADLTPPPPSREAAAGLIPHTK